MAVFKPMIIQKNETDIGKVVRQLYSNIRFQI